MVVGMAMSEGDSWGRTTYYANLENTIYVHSVKAEEDSIFSYFFIATKIGVGKKRNEKDIKVVRIELEFNSVNSEGSDIEIQDHRPTNTSKEIGQIQGTSKKHFNFGGKIVGQYSIDAVIASSKGDGHLEGGKESEEIKTYSYPNTIQIVSSNGVGNNINWEFKQGDGAGKTGEYDINILFRLRNKIEEIKEGEGSFTVSPKVTINGIEINKVKDGGEIKQIPIFIIK